MSKFIKGQDRRSQGKLFPERLEDCVDEYNPVRVIDVFIDDLDISGLGFKAEAAATGRPGYDPKTMPNNHWVWEWCWSDNLYNVRMFLCFRSKPESTPKWMFRQTKVA